MQAGSQPQMAELVGIDINMGREPIYLTELSLSNIPHMRANFPGRFCDASQFTSYDGTEVPIYLIWKRRRANLPLT